MNLFTWTTKLNFIIQAIFLSSLIWLETLKSGLNVQHVVGLRSTRQVYLLGSFLPTIFVTLVPKSWTVFQFFLQIQHSLAFWNRSHKIWRWNGYLFGACDSDFDLRRLHAGVRSVLADQRGQCLGVGEPAHVRVQPFRPTAIRGY